MKIIYALFFVMCAISLAPAFAAPSIYDRQTGKYLGNLSANKFDPDSTSNEFGRYGSKFSPDSINNEFGKYGSPYSPDSANNPYAVNPPVIRGLPGDEYNAW